ncbi:MAG: hypothetical protein KatS3mg023_3857 [Armatimonadota bacterium]|nr:MAG: hypothetical protein KatS3mg023_3857 [Armatimonadota bacterium]
MTIGIDWDRLGVIGLFLGTALALFVAFVLVTQKEVNDRLRPVRYHVQRTEAYMNDIKINVVDARKQTNEAIVLIQEAIVSRDEKKLIAALQHLSRTDVNLQEMENSCRYINDELQDAKQATKP